MYIAFDDSDTSAVQINDFNLRVPPPTGNFSFYYYFYLINFIFSPGIQNPFTLYSNGKLAANWIVADFQNDVSFKLEVRIYSFIFLHYYIFFYQIKKLLVINYY
jgi:hypothetical protein